MELEALLPKQTMDQLLGAPVVAPHYSAMTASLRPEETIAMWDWLIENGHFSPLNNVESLMFPVDLNCDPANIEWNQLKGSWNLSLQTLGWGRYLGRTRWASAHFMASGKEESITAKRVLTPDTKYAIEYNTNSAVKRKPFNAIGKIEYIL